MRSCAKQIPYVLLALLWLGSVLGPVDAYVLQGPHILELMVEKLGKARGLWVTQALQFHPNESRPDPLEMTETLRFRFPEMFRSDIRTENTERIHVYAREEVLTIIDGKAEVDTETRFDLYKDLLLFRSRPLLTGRLTRFGVDVSVSSLGRFDDKVCFVVGARYPDETVPQVWIEKQTFLPCRWIITRSAGGDRKDSLEVRYRRWHKVDKTYYPKTIEFYQGDSLVRSIEADEIRVNPTFPDSLFDITHLKSVNQPATPVEADRLDPGEVDEIQQSLEDFRRILE